MSQSHGATMLTVRQVSDGPNGVRGNHFFMSTPAKCFPSSTALGATFDPELVRTVGLKLIAEEAKLRAASVVLAPTCNIQRVSIQIYFSLFYDDSNGTA